MNEVQPSAPPLEQEVDPDSVELSERDQIRIELEALFDSDDDVFEEKAADFVDARLQELDPRPGQLELIKAIDGNKQGFIGAESVLFPFALGKGYNLDDAEAYKHGLNHMRTFYKRFSDKVPPEKAYTNAALYSAQYAQQEYFGNVHNQTGAFAVREALLADIVDDDDAPEVRSIGEFKGLAMCAERAAIANNVLHILGMKPVLEMGTLKIDEKGAELHAFLFVNNDKDTEYLFDTTNPKLTFDTAGKLIMVEPALYPTGDALQTRDSKTPIHGVRKQFVFEDGDKNLRKEEDYRFYLSSFGKELHPF